MNVYRLENKNHAFMFVAATNTQEAIAIAKKAGHLRTEPKSVSDFSKGAPYGISIPAEILNGKKTGPMGLIHDDFAAKGRWEINRYWKG